MTAAYGGSSTTAGSTSAALIQVVSQSPTVVATTTLTSSLSPSSVGQSITSKAVVTPSGATGTSTFLDGSTPLA